MLHLSLTASYWRGSGGEGVVILDTGNFEPSAGDSYVPPRLRPTVLTERQNHVAP